MAARSGMVDIITEIRRLVNDSGSATWTDDQIQTVADMCRLDIMSEELTPVPVMTHGGSAIYMRYISEYDHFEQASSGTERWKVFDYVGATIGTTDYTVDYANGIVTFNVSQRGSARYLRARSYDVYCAASWLWRERAGMKAENYDFSADGARFNRAQWYQHCMEMADRYAALQRPTVAEIMRTDTL